MQVCYEESKQLCVFASMQVHMYASMQHLNTFKYASTLACKYESKQVFVCKYASEKVSNCVCFQDCK